jgi:hypothetical protein
MGVMDRYDGKNSVCGEHRCALAAKLLGTGSLVLWFLVRLAEGAAHRNRAPEGPVSKKKGGQVRLATLAPP